MVSKLTQDGCIYQDDVVDYLVKGKAEAFLEENADGNLVLSRPVLKSFHHRTEEIAVWVGKSFYWRVRVPQDDVGRNARG